MANYTLQSHGGEGLYMTADGTPTARRNVYIKARVSDSLDQTWRIDSPSNGARTRIFSCKSNNTGGGVVPCKCSRKSPKNLLN